MLDMFVISHCTSDCPDLIILRCQRIKTDFTFEYNYLEDDPIV